MIRLIIANYGTYTNITVHSDLSHYLRKLLQLPYHQYRKKKIQYFKRNSSVQHQENLQS
jgi:hypothetical protein